MTTFWDCIPQLESWQQVIASLSFLLGIAGLAVCMFAQEKELALRVAGIAFILTLALFSDAAWNYFLSLFLVATSITSLEFLEKLAAILRGNKEYFDLQIARVEKINIPQPSEASIAGGGYVGNVEETNFKVVSASIVEAASDEVAPKNGEVDKTPEEVRELVKEIRSEFDKRNHDRVVELAKTILSSDPQNLDGLSFLGRTYNRMGSQFNSHLAEPIAEKLIEFHPDKADGYHLMADFVSITPARAPEAVTLYSKALGIDPTLIRAYIGRSRVYAQMQDTQNSDKDFAKAEQIDPENSWVLAEKGIRESKKKNYEDAIRFFDRALQIDPNYAYVYIFRADAFRSLKRFAEAINDAREVLRLVPNHAFGFQSLASTHHALQDFEQAIKYATQANEKVNNIPLVMAIRGDSHRMLKNYELAIEDLTKAIERAPTYSWALASRAAAQNAVQQFQLALRDAERALMLAPSYEFAKRQFEVAKSGIAVEK